MLVNLTFYKNEKDLGTSPMDFNEFTAQLTRLFAVHEDDTTAIMLLKHELNDIGEATYKIPTRYSKTAKFDQVKIKPVDA
ncbi:hypothetical protein F7U66_02060 [Vibrio parahaemolyticus]|nr:hypothetical protein [Vibrio parahaemolyticus]